METNRIIIAKRIIVCGGRDFGRTYKWQPKEEYQLAIDQREFLFDVLDFWARCNSIAFKPDDNWLPTDLTVIEGGATGADDCAAGWAACTFVNHIQIKADWDRYKKAAGYIRNRQMLDESKPDAVFAFPGGKGTENMKSIARKAGVPVYEFSL